MEDYFSFIESFDIFIDGFKKSINDYSKDLQNENKVFDVKTTRMFRDYIYNMNMIKELLKMFEISKPLINNYESYLNLINFGSDYKETLFMLIDNITSLFNENKDAIFNEMKKIDVEERKRLNEALFTLHTGCFFSSIAMSISALENRLFEILQKKNSEALKKHSKDSHKEVEKLTFGDLCGIYLRHKDEFGMIIPEKYERVLEKCNQIRIFAVHPKKEFLNEKDATAIFNEVFSFLLDDKCKPPS